jgi:ureidoacrylate peracid hydrolase
MMSEVDQFSSKTAAVARPTIEPAHTAIIVVDLVNDFVERTGAMPMPDAGETLSKARDLAEIARRSGALVVWVRPGHIEDVDGLFRKRIPHGFVDTWGAQIHDSLGVLEGERVVTKRRYSSFFQTDLDLILREHKIERVVVCGVALNICVRSTIHDAFFNGYDVWLAKDASKATGPREEASTIYDIETHFGEVLTVDEIRAELQK